MHFPVPLLIPLACGFIYVVGALMLKRSAVFGIGVWRTTFIANWTVALLFLPFWFWQGGVLHPLADYLQPATTGLLFLIGQVFMFLALSSGDVSVAGPVMGAKVIFVALFSVLVGAGSVPLQWWIGAGLSAAAVALLNRKNHARHRGVARTTLLAMASAVSYALSDALLQKWVPAWGAANYVPPSFLIVGFYSFVFIPFFHAPLSEITCAGWKWVGPASLLIAINNAGIVLAISLFGDATAVNIVYSSRGLWSVVLVWLVGHWFMDGEQLVGRRVLLARLAGAALMVAAIVQVLL